MPKVHKVSTVTRNAKVWYQCYVLYTTMSFGYLTPSALCSNLILGVFVTFWVRSSDTMSVRKANLSNLLGVQINNCSSSSVDYLQFWNVIFKCGSFALSFLIIHSHQNIKLLNWFVQIVKWILQNCKCIFRNCKMYLSCWCIIYVCWEPFSSIQIKIFEEKLRQTGLYFKEG